MPSTYSPIKGLFLATRSRSLQVSQKVMCFKLLFCGSLPARLAGGGYAFLGEQLPST